MPSDINHFTPDDWAARFSGDIHSFVQTLSQLKWTADRWYKFAYGLTDAQIAALPQMSGWAEADVTQVQAAAAAIRSLYDVATGNGTQGTAYDFLDVMAFFL